MPTAPSPREVEVNTLTSARDSINEIIGQLNSMVPTDERKVAIVKLREGVMWLNEDLKRIAAEMPAPAPEEPTQLPVV